MSYGYKIISNNIHEKQRVLYPWMKFESVFTEEDVNRISEYCSITKPLIDGTTAKLNGSHARKSKINFHNANDQQLSWVFEKLNSFLTDINSLYYNFDLNGYDSFQYTEYYAKDGGKYDYHMDTFLGQTIIDKSDQYETRKLSLTLLLNEPDKDFTGGEFSVYTGMTDTIPMKKGDILVFPSFMIHKVNEITSGTRKSLVVWVVGPKFK